MSMQAYLLNFGANTRVVNDSSNMAVSIGIGELKECDIHDVHFHMIRRAVATETLLVVPKDVKKTEQLSAIMGLMAKLQTEAYDEVLAEYNLLGGNGEDNEDPKVRPSRDQMMLMLRDMARKEVATALRLQSKVIIREQGDDVTRRPVPRPEPKTIIAPEAKQPPPPAKKAKAAKAPAKRAKKPVPASRKRERL